MLRGGRGGKLSVLILACSTRSLRAKTCDVLYVYVWFAARVPTERYAQALSDAKIECFFIAHLLSELGKGANVGLVHSEMDEMIRGSLLILHYGFESTANVF